jgi:ElaB/YqjD/DUF883 family membrane-anchored ribosome-binding protein
MFSFLRSPHSGNGSHGSSSASIDLAEEARQCLDQAGQEVKDRFGELEEMVGAWVKARPGLTLGAALAVGVVIGWLIKRR